MRRIGLDRAKVGGRFGALLLLMLAASACERRPPDEPPPRVTTPAAIPVQRSTIGMPISLKMSGLETLVNAHVPKSLWTIDEHRNACVPAQRLTVCLKHKESCDGEECRDVPCAFGFQRKKITPDISCRIVGEVTRGAITLKGVNGEIHLTMPVHAEVSALDVAHVIDRRATAVAEVRAKLALSMGPDWNPVARIDIDYGWIEKPGTAFLGKRFTFSGKADPKIEKVIADLERTLPRDLKTLGLKERVEGAWQGGFTTIELNHENPPVWMRITPEKLGVGAFEITRDRMNVHIGLAAVTETFIGERPDASAPAPLPPLSDEALPDGFRLLVPVIADYEELIPVLKRALDRLSAKGISVPVIGEVEVRFNDPIAYTTTGGRIAVGLVMDVAKRQGRQLTSGTVWLTGVPHNEPGSARVVINDLEIHGKAADRTGDLLLAVARTDAVQAVIATELTQDFSRDIGKLRGKIDVAVGDLKVGGIGVEAKIDDLRFGVVQPIGQGLYLPVEVTGTSTVRLPPAGQKAR